MGANVEDTSSDGGASISGVGGNVPVRTKPALDLPPISVDKDINEDEIRPKETPAGIMQDMNEDLYSNSTPDPSDESRDKFQSLSVEKLKGRVPKVVWEPLRGVPRQSWTSMKEKVGYLFDRISPRTLFSTVHPQKQEDVSSFSEKMQNIKISFSSTGHTAYGVITPPFSDGRTIVNKLEAHNLKSKPKTMICIHGGADKLTGKELKNEIRQLISRGVAKAAVDKSSCVVTGATDVGVMQDIGQCLAERRSGKSTDSQIIGITPGPLTKWPGKMTDPDEDYQLAELEPNHDFFVLVDVNQWGQETETMFKVSNSLANVDSASIEKFIEQRNAHIRDVRESHSTWIYTVFPCMRPSNWELEFNPEELRIQRTPVISLCVNGGDGVRKEVLNSVRQEWPVVVIYGSGRFADEISQLWVMRHILKDEAPPINDPEISEIINDGIIHIFPVALPEPPPLELPDKPDNMAPDQYRCLVKDHEFQVAFYDYIDSCLDKHEHPAANLRELITRLLNDQNSTKDDSLHLAWQRYALFRSNSERLHRKANRLHLAVICLSVMGTFFAVLGTTLNCGWFHSDDTTLRSLRENEPFYEKMLYYLTLSVPILTTIFVAAYNRFNAKRQYLILKHAADSIKAEIYKYRAGVGTYNQKTLAPSVLQNEVRQVCDSVTEGDIAFASLYPYTGRLPPPTKREDDDNVSPLTPEKYIAVRLIDKLEMFQKKNRSYEKRYRLMLWATYLWEGIGTLLAALEYELWIAVTSSVVSAINHHLDYLQLDTIIVRYNGTANQLANIRMWWESLPITQKSMKENADRLVISTEETLIMENAKLVSTLSNKSNKIDEFGTPENDDNNGDDDGKGTRLDSDDEDIRKREKRRDRWYGKGSSGIEQELEEMRWQLDLCKTRLKDIGAGASNSVIIANVTLEAIERNENLAKKVNERVGVMSTVRINDRVKSPWADILQRYNDQNEDLYSKLEVKQIRDSSYQELNIENSDDYHNEEFRKSKSRRRRRSHHRSSMAQPSKGNDIFVASESDSGRGQIKIRRRYDDDRRIRHHGTSRRNRSHSQHRSVSLHTHSDGSQ